MNGRHSFWNKGDWITAALATVISLAVYVWSAAPNVTLLDSGEFMVAAQHFGVPHPTGYPLWTLLTWLFQLLPLGNAAWEINVFSGVCAAISVGLCAALLSNVFTWCLNKPLVGKLRFLPGIVALAFALMLAFSQSMWSQAVIAEVYALHALLVALFLIACYAWVRNPSSDFLMLLAYFILALAFSNHQLSMVLVLPVPFPLPLLLVLLLRRRCFFDWLFAGTLTLLLGYLGFAILSKDQAVLKTAIRFFYCVALAFGVFVWLRRFRVRWKLIAFLPIAVGLGLLPYLYMPLASSTNPPMNWGYARDIDGFFFSFNRSQYPGSLSEMTVKSLGRVMGVSPQTESTSGKKRPEFFSAMQMAQRWIGHFWLMLNNAFSPFGLIGYFASIIFVLRLPLARRTWVYFLHIAFVLAAFLQPISANTKIDVSDWWTQMPYHTYTNLIFAVLSGLGVGLLIDKLCEKRSAAFWVAPLLLILPIFTFRGSEPSSSQRGRWFGWQYGYDMLKDLPKGSIMIGGTDAGRFVPTYMILGESTQPAGVKRDPNFDRRDLYIITQNALGEPNYMKYLRDQYTTQRPQPKNAFERWLGRADAYPKEPIALPDENEIEEYVKAFVKENAEAGKEIGDKGTTLFSAVLKWLWEKNRDRHEFFVEESFPIEWTYEYALPHGLVYQINKTKLDKIPADVVVKDLDFWKKYVDRLLADPSYGNDLDAQRSFSKLRQTTANIYRYRKMIPEAKLAYLQAVQLWPNNLEAILFLMNYYWEEGDYDTPIKLLTEAANNDPENIDAWRMVGIAEKRKEAEGEIKDLTRKLAEQPNSSETLKKLIELYASMADTNRATPLVERVLKDFPNDTDMLRFVIEYHEQLEEPGKIIEPAIRLTQLESSNVANYLLLARAYHAQEKKKEFYDAAGKAVELGGDSIRDIFMNEPGFSNWSTDPEFKKLTEPPLLVPK